MRSPVRRRFTTFAAALALALGGAFVAASPAYAGCQSAPFRMVFSTGQAGNYYCSGTYFPNRRTTSISTGPWGGYVVQQIGGGLWAGYYFCDNDGWAPNVVVREVYLAASRPSWC